MRPGEEGKAFQTKGTDVKGAPVRGCVERREVGRQGGLPCADSTSSRRHPQAQGDVGSEGVSLTSHARSFFLCEMGIIMAIVIITRL